MFLLYVFLYNRQWVTSSALISPTTTRWSYLTTQSFCARFLFSIQTTFRYVTHFPGVEPQWYKTVDTSWVNRLYIIPLAARWLNHRFGILLYLFIYFQGQNANAWEKYVCAAPVFSDVNHQKFSTGCILGNSNDRMDSKIIISRRSLHLKSEQWWWWQFCCPVFIPKFRATKNGLRLPGLFLLYQAV